MPRQRSVRLAGLAPPAQRGSSKPYRVRVSGAVRRRLVAALLVVASLAMITAYFRESESGPMHDVQGFASSALEPFQAGAERAVTPFRDAWGYVSGLIDAKSDADKYRKELESLRAQSFQFADAIQRANELEALLAYRSAKRFPRDYTSIAADVISDPLTRYQQRIVIAAGHDDGIRRDFPVVVRAGLVGHVTKVYRQTAQITLITDPQSTVSAYDVRTGAQGGIRGRGEGRSLLLDRVPNEEVVEEGDRVATSGRRYLKLPSLFPRNIGVGTVKSVSRRDTELFPSVQVEPFVDFSSLHSVLVLIPKEPLPRLPVDDAR